MLRKECSSGQVVRDKVPVLQEAADRERIPIKIIGGMEYYYREKVLYDTDSRNFNMIFCGPVYPSFSKLLRNGRFGNLIE